MEETKRLVREKAYAVHAVAAALMEHGELIGTELEAVFARADAANVLAARPFERKLFTLPRLFEDRSGAAAVEAGSSWPATQEEAAAASAVAARRGAGVPAEGVEPDGSWPAAGFEEVPSVESAEAARARRLPPMPPPVWPAPAGRGGLYTPEGPIDPRDPHQPPRLD
jgi:hypothetical protein